VVHNNRRTPYARRSTPFVQRSLSHYVANGCKFPGLQTYPHRGISLPLYPMRTTTKLKHILQLYTVTIDMDDEAQMHLMIFDKRDNSSEEFINKSYSVVVDKAFRYMMKKIKSPA
jgi:hypothetical protein